MKKHLSLFLIWFIFWVLTPSQVFAAITASVLTTGHDTVLSSFTTASVTLTTGKAYLALVKIEDSNANTRNHAAISGWTYDKYTGAPVLGSNNIAINALWIAGDGTTGTRTITFGGQSQSWVDWQIIEFSGVDVAQFIVQSFATAAAVAGNPNGTLATFGSGSNATFVGAAYYDFGAMSAASGYSLISTATGDLSFASAYKIGQDLTPSIVAPPSPFRDEWVFYAAEIKIADTTAPVLSSVLPTSSSSINSVTSSSDISFTTDEAIAAGTGTITITRTGGTADATVHTCTLKGTALNVGAHTISLSDTTNGCTSDVSSLVSGAIYTFVFAASDASGNAATSVTRTNVTFDNTAPVFSSVTPTSSSSIDNVTTSSDISFTTDEALASGSIVITRTSGTADASSPHTCTLKGTGLNSGAHTINLADTTNGCTSDVSNLAPLAVYTFVFNGTDAAGNTATTITRTSVTFNPDSTPPVISNGSPSGTLPLNTTSTTLSVTTDENATCKYGTVAGTAYASIASTFNTTGGTSHSQSLTGLTNNSSYTYYVRCIDSFSNANTSDYTISFSVASSAGGSGGLTGELAGENPTPPQEVLPPPTETLPPPVVVTPPLVVVPPPQTDGCSGRTSGFNTVNGTSCGTTTTNPPLTTKVTPKSPKTTVMLLQTLLNHALGINLKTPLVVDGSWGPKTTAAVKLFQKIHHLQVDGLVGPVTRGELNGVTQ